MNKLNFYEMLPYLLKGKDVGLKILWIGLNLTRSKHWEKYIDINASSYGMIVHDATCVRIV
jgi:hypothetical protein